MRQTFAYAISALYKDFYAYAGERLNPLGLHQGWIYCMLYVGKHPGCAPAEMTRALRMDWGYSQRCVTRMVESGFLNKERVGRAYRLNLTEKGKQAFRESQCMFFSWDADKLAGLTGTERATLLALMHKVAEAAETGGAERMEP